MNNYYRKVKKNIPVVMRRDKKSLILKGSEFYNLEST